MFNVRDKFEKVLVYTKKLPVANSKWKFATGCKKCHGKKNTINPPLVKYRFQLLLVFGFSKLPY